MEMEDLSNGRTQSTSSASSTMELEREDTMCINPGTHDNNEDAEPPTAALDRDKYGVLGSSRSMEDVQRSGNSVVTTQRPRPSPAPSGQATQGNAATTPQRSADSAKMLPHGRVSSSSAPTTANANTITLHSQHSNDSTVNSTNSGSVYVPAYSQTTRPQSLVNRTASQHSQASSSGAPPPPTNYSAVCPLRTNSTESNTSHTSCSSDGRVSNATTPVTTHGPAALPFSGTPTSPMVDLAVATMYTSSQTSLQYDSSGPGHGLPLNRSAYTAVGCSQEDVQRPCQCTQQPAIGQMSQGNTNSSAVGHTSTSSSTASTPHQQYGSTMGYTGSTNSTSSTPQQQYPGNPPSLGASPGMVSHNGPGVIRYNSQHSNESTGSGILDNSISAHTFHSQPTRRQSLTYISAPFVHNQTMGPNYYNYTASQPPTLNRMDSNPPQNSAAGVYTPTDDSTPSFFPSPNQGSICPPSHVPLSAPQNATNT
jgi:hypothetical protein